MCTKDMKSEYNALCVFFYCRNVDSKGKRVGDYSLNVQLNAKYRVPYYYKQSWNGIYTLVSKCGLLHVHTIPEYPAGVQFLELVNKQVL